MYGKVITIGLVTFLTVIFIVFAVTARLVLFAYFASSHCAFIGFICGVYTLLHLCLKLNPNGLLRHSTWLAIHTIGSAVLFLSTLGAAISYSILVTTTMHINFDFLLAIAITAVTSIILGGLTLERIGKTRRRSNDDVMHEELILMKNFDSHPNEVRLTGEYEDESTCTCCSVLLLLLYIVFHVLFTTILLGSVYYPVSVSLDYKDCMNGTAMRTVTLSNHNSLSFYWQCAGAGDHTIVLEHSPEAFGSAALPYLANHLQTDYEVCTYSRYGHGLSEGLETDNPMFYDLARDYTFNSEYFFQLVNKTGVRKPFIYAGHSYSAAQVAITASQYPDLVKGVVLIDPLGLNTSANSSLDPIHSRLYRLLTRLSHIQPTGVIHLALDTGLFNLSHFLGGYVETEGLTTDTYNLIKAEFRSGTLYQSAVRELHLLSNSDVTSSSVVTSPTLIVTSRESVGTRFPFSRFPPPSTDTNPEGWPDQVVVANATHYSLMYQHYDSIATSNAIKRFITKRLD